MLEIPRIFRVLGWNKRPLTYDDFLWACDELEIKVQRPLMKTPGMYFECRGQQVVSLSSRLQGVSLWRVAFHELAHSQLHAPGLRCFCPGSVSKAESEADALGLSSVIDEPKLYRIIAEGELHDFPQKMVAARLKIAEQRLF
jgi:hypothetical protein